MIWRLLLLLLTSVSLAGQMPMGGVTYAGSTPTLGFVNAGTVIDLTSQTSKTMTATSVVAHNQIVFMSRVHAVVSAVTCSDASGSTWSTPVVVAGSTYTQIECHTLNELGSGSVNITMSWTGSSTYAGYGWAQSSGTTVLDGSVATTPQPSGTAWTLPSVTTTASGIVFGFGWEEQNDTTFTGTNGWTVGSQVNTGGSGASVVLLYKLTSAGANAPTCTLGTSASGFATTAGFK